MLSASAGTSPTSGGATAASYATSGGSNYHLLSVAELTELCLALGALSTNNAPSSSGKPELAATLLVYITRMLRCAAAGVCCTHTIPPIEVDRERRARRFSRVF